MASEKPHQDDAITFTLGVGNQSSICGGVKPMRIVEDDVTEATQQSAEDQTQPVAVDRAS